MFQTSDLLLLKLYAEIKLHRALQHPNIVTFEDCFEDGDHVYMTLELCDNGVSTEPPVKLSLCSQL